MKTQIIKGVENRDLFKCLYENDIDIKKPYIIKQKNAADLLLTINNLKKQGRGRTIIIYNVFDNYWQKNKACAACFDNLKNRQGHYKPKGCYNSIHSRWRSDIKADFVNTNKQKADYFIINQSEENLRERKEKRTNPAERFKTEEEQKNATKRSAYFYGNRPTNEFDKSGYWLNHYRGALNNRLHDYKESKATDKLPYFIERWERETLPRLKAIFEVVSDILQKGLKNAYFETVDFIYLHYWHLKDRKKDFEKLQRLADNPETIEGYYGQKLSSIDTIEEFKSLEGRANELFEEVNKYFNPLGISY